MLPAIEPTAVAPLLGWHLPEPEAHPSAEYVHTRVPLHDSIPGKERRLHEVAFDHGVTSAVPAYRRHLGQHGREQPRFSFPGRPD
eukprot:1814064-Prymnesium_polylepis.2